jgi:hypothetical protein
MRYTKLSAVQPCCSLQWVHRYALCEPQLFQDQTPTSVNRTIVSDQHVWPADFRCHIIPNAKRGAETQALQLIGSPCSGFCCITSQIGDHNVPPLIIIIRRARFLETPGFGQQSFHVPMKVLHARDNGGANFNFPAWN